MNDGPRIDAPTRRATIKWGRAPTLDAFETIMWRLDRYPNLRAAVVCVVILDQEPDVSRVQEVHQRAVRLIPRLREKLVDVPFGLPAWVADDRFVLTTHLGFHQLSSRAGMREVLDHASAMAMAPFDHGRPPWEAQVVTGMAGGRAAYILKLHHAMSDGIGIVQLLSLLFSRGRETDGGQPEVSGLSPARSDTPSPLTLLAQQVSRNLRDIPVKLRAGGARLRGRRGAGEGVRAAISEVAHYAASVRRAMAPMMAEPSALLADRNHQWHFEILDVPLAPFKAAAKSCEATLNDAYVAGLLGGFARYHREFGVEIDEVPIGMPINIRVEGADGGGNHFAPGQLIGPVGDMTARQRMRLIGSQVARLRKEPALAAPLAIMPLLVSLPANVLAKAMGPKMAANDLQCSNVPGIREEVFMGGAQATHVYPYAPLPGVPAMISLVTHGSNCCIGMNLDSAAIADPARFRRCVHESFDEILSLAPISDSRVSSSGPSSAQRRQKK